MGIQAEHALAHGQDAVRTLPADAQDAIAHGLIMEVEHYGASHLTDAQRAIVRERLGKPVTTVSSDAAARTLKSA